jgi:SH3 domain-containing YSC84-like protein 1
MKYPYLLVLSLALVALSSASLQADSVMSVTSNATDILEKKQGSVEPIPAQALNEAKGVAILEITKAGLVFGGTGGDGIVVLKQKGLLPWGTKWSAPLPIGFGGGSFGAQIGFSTTRMIVLLNSDQAVKTFTNPGKLEWNAAASGTAGADTSTEQVGGLLSDVDVKIYKESGGLYGGATFGGGTIRIQDDRIKKAYGSDVFVRDIVSGKVKSPDYATRLYKLLNGKR